MNLILEYAIGHLLIVGLILCLRICVKEKVGEKYHRGFWWLEFICVIVLTIHLLYKMFTLEHQDCVYHHSCYGKLDDDLLHSDESVYETYNECGDSISFTYETDNYEIEYLDEEVPCEKTEFGCCSLHNRCQTSTELNFTYNNYRDVYGPSIDSDNDITGVIQMGFKKNDKDGSNCPTYDDIFELREWYEIRTLFYFYLYIFDGVMMYFCIILCLNCCSKDEHNFSPVDKEEVKQLATV